MVTRTFWHILSKYWLQQRRVNHQIDPGILWNMLWKSSLFPKWKVFIWKLLTEGIATRSNLQKRKINVSPLCGMCNSQLETEEHLFRNCDFASHVWSAGSLGVKTQSSVGVESKRWVRDYLSFFMKEDGKEDDRLVMFVATLWSLWLLRNACVFKGGGPNPSSIMQLIEHWKTRWNASTSKLPTQVPHCVQRSRSVQPLYWKYGTPGSHLSAIAEVDGAWKEVVKDRQG